MVRTDLVDLGGLAEVLLGLVIRHIGGLVSEVRGISVLIDCNSVPSRLELDAQLRTVSPVRNQEGT